MKNLYYHKDKYLAIAETEEEITPGQYLMISAVLHSEMNMLAASIALLKILSNKSWLAFKQIPGDVKLNCVPYVEWLLNAWSPSHQLLPRFRNFYGPADELDNLTLAEFYSTERFYAEFVESTDTYDSDQALNNLVAVLYREAKPGYDHKKDLDGDARQPFNSNATRFYSSVISTWPKHVRQAILLYYDGCRKKLGTLYPEIFQKKSAADQDNDNDMFGLIRGLAGGKYGDFEKTEMLSLHTALRELQCLLAEEEKIKAQTPAA